MITRITKENSVKYRDLFDSATELLKKYNAEAYKDLTISSLEEYFKVFRDIVEVAEIQQKNLYYYTRLPLDEEFFEIDLNSRQINIPTSFKKSGIAIQHDNMAEVVYFKTDRFFENIDLSQTLIFIQWEAPNGNKSLSSAVDLDIHTIQEKIIFGWPIAKTMTTSSGSLKFSVIFIDKKVLQDGNLKFDKANYRLGTLTNYININPGLNLIIDENINVEDYSKMLRDRITNSPETDIFETGASPISIINYTGLDWNTADFTIEEINQLPYDVNTTVTKENCLIVSAKTDGAGIITYEWHKDGTNDVLQGPQRAIDYVIAPEVQNNDYEYWVAQDVLTNDYRRFDSKNDNFNELRTEGKLFIKVSAYPVTTPGSYYARIINKEGRKGSEKNTVKAIIPGPAAIEKVDISTSTGKNIIDGEENLKLLSATELKAGEANNRVNYSYQWYVNGEIIEDGILSEFTPSQIGTYKLEVKNNWNNASTDSIFSQEITLYETAVTPEITYFEADKYEYVSIEDNYYVASIGAKLTVDYKPINQEGATEFVRWLGDISADGIEHFEYIRKPKIDENGNIIKDTNGNIEYEPEVDENGNIIKDKNDNVVYKLIEGKEFIPFVTGNYKPVIINYIDENNNKETIAEKVIRITQE